MRPYRDKCRAALAISRASGDGAYLRWGQWISRQCTAALVLMTMLLIAVGFLGCGSANGRDSADSNRTVSAAGREKKALEATVAEELAYRRSASGPRLARVGLPGGDVIGGVAIQCGPAR